MTGESLKTAIYLTNDEIEQFKRFRERQDQVNLLERTGFFSMKRGSITYHFNAEGAINGFEIKQVGVSFDM